MTGREMGGVAPTVDTGTGSRRAPSVTMQIWRHRRLLGWLARTSFAMRYRGALLGLAWAVFLPLVQAVVLIIVFSRVSGLSSTEDYGLYVLGGTVWSSYFSQSLTTGGIAIVSSGDLVDKLWFPRVLLPVVAPLANLVQLAITAGLVVAVAAFRHGLPGWRLLLLIPLAVLLVLFSAILASLAALAHAWFRDVGHAIPVLLVLGFYLTPVIYEPGQLGSVGRLLSWNPVGGLLDLGRAAVSSTQPIAWRGLGVAAAIIVAGWALTERAYRRYDHDVADLL
jgi:lipopolysaccharide transport system permease protein